MKETIFLINKENQLVELSEAKYDSEFLLQQMLSEIEGVNITEEQLDKRPNFDLLLLKGEGMRQFKAAFKWFYGLFK